MRLIIAEKPSLAQAIAEALPGTSKRLDGAVVCGDTVIPPINSGGWTGFPLCRSSGN